MNIRNINNKRGFTIVELLIVIVVIAILAAVSVVAYNGIQERARDSQRKHDLASLSRALQLYKIDYGGLATNSSGCNAPLDGQGWVSQGAYWRTIVDCLIDSDYLEKNSIDPSGCIKNNQTTCRPPKTHAYMKLDCSNGSETYSYLMARMETASMDKPSDMTNSACQYDSWWDAYGMNYAVKVR